MSMYGSRTVTGGPCDYRTPAASGFVAVGDRVIALTRFGAYATALNVGLAYLRAAPADWTAAEAAAWAVQGSATIGKVVLQV
jgi:NADPH:quinone reductase-like Zn-dependent oxidoreductase